MALPGFRIYHGRIYYPPCIYASMMDRFACIRNCVSVEGNEFLQTIERAFHFRYDSLTNGHFIYVTAHLHIIWPPCTYELDHMVLSIFKEPLQNLKMSRISFKKRELGINNGAFNVILHSNDCGR